MIPRVNIISRKANAASINVAEGTWGCSEPPRGGGEFRGLVPLRNFLGSKEHLDWLKIDLNMAEIITVQDYKCT